MTATIVIYTAGFMISLGVVGAMIRRSLLAIALCLQLSFLGAMLLFSTFSQIRGNEKGLSIAIVLMLAFSLQMLLVCALAVFTYRHRGTLNVDELRELRG